MIGFFSQRVCCALSSLPCAVLLSLLLLAPAAAQDNVPTVTRTYALENATVVQAPGQVLSNTTVVVRNGLIHAVDEDVAIPFDAQRIEADSLTVYAGFISGLAYAGVEEPDDAGNDQRIEDPGNPPNDRAGIQPDRSARALLNPSDNKITALREVGFTAAHVVPEGQMLPGQGALVQLAGDDPNAMTLDADVSLFAQFEGARGVYPATAMANIATWRQLYREAERRKQLEPQYAQDPRGQKRPPSDPAHSAFFPVIDGTIPVFFYTDDVLETHRALALHNELGFSMALAGLHESFRALEALQTADASLFLSLDLPEDKKWMPPTAEDDTTETAEDAPPPDPSSFFVSAFRTRSYEDTDEEIENLKARQALERETYYQNAAILHDAGLQFSFMTADVDARDIRANLRTMIEHGLPEETALASLTTHPASALGLSAQLGTVESGKIANLVVTDGNYFDEDTAIRHVFVDGQRFDIEEAASAPEGEEGTASPAGAWSYTISTPQGEFGGRIKLTGQPGDLEGTITSDMDSDETELEDLELDGTTLTFSFDAGPSGQVDATATIRGDEMEGTIEIPNFGTAPLSATRTSNPER